MTNFSRLFLYSTLIGLLATPLTTISAQEDTPPATPQETDEEKQVETLRSTLGYIHQLRSEMKELSSKLKKLDGEEKKKTLEDYRETQRKLGALESDFRRIASGINSAIFEEESKGLDWEKEVVELVSPLVNQLKSLTARPRKIEKLRQEIETAKAKLPEIRKALVNLKRLATKNPDKDLQRELRETIKEWKAQDKTVCSQLAVASHQLQEMTKEKKSLVESSQEILKIFFKSRGKNLLFAIGAFISVFFVLRLFHRFIYRFSPLHTRANRPFYIRFFDVLYHIITALGSLGAMLIMLYISGDWMLLSLAIIFLIGVVWTTKQTIPVFWNEIQMLLNIGTVREGERINYNGIPYRVVSLNLSTTLVNPELGACEVRLPIRELLDSISRPVYGDEPWFPSRPKDWVILSDGCRGQVSHQSPDMVKINLPGNSSKLYPTSAYLGLNPINISKGFRISTAFGISYKHQPIAVTEVPRGLKDFLETRLAEEQFDHMVTKVSVEFKSANASSLDFEIFVDFTGEAAPKYATLSRALQKYAVEACNAKDWDIPYQTLTIVNEGS
jgi:hypothetical protein